jgi:hypothetical protein
MVNEYGPFDTEREALATRAAAVIRAAFDAHPGVGASVPECLKLMTDTCEESGIALGYWDLSFLQGVAWGETADCIRLRGMIRRAYLAGLAARNSDRIGYTVVTWPQTDGSPDIEFGTGLLFELDQALALRDEVREDTERAGRSERHEVAEVVKMEEAND